MPFQNPLTPAALAAAIAGTTLTITGQVTTTPTTSTDEDEVRSYTQAQIDALTATDKNTNFTIYNKTTGVINYCVDGNIFVPPAAAAKNTTGWVDLTGTTISGASGSPSTRTINTGVSNPKRVNVRVGTASTASTGRPSNGLDLTTPAGAGWSGRGYLNLGSNTVGIFLKNNTDTTLALQGHLYGSGGTVFTVYVTNFTVSAAGVITISWYPSTSIALDSNTSLEWEVLS